MKRYVHELEDSILRYQLSPSLPIDSSNTNENSCGCFVKLWVDSKMYMEMQRLCTVKTILKKENKTDEFTLLDFVTDLNAPEIKF